MIILLAPTCLQTYFTFATNLCIFTVGTTIWSDEWAAYRTLGQVGYQHVTVNHSRFYVDPNTGVHTNDIESRWNAAKKRFRQMFGVHREFIAEYLDEHMWRSRRPQSDYLHDFVDAISRRYPV